MLENRLKWDVIIKLLRQLTLVPCFFLSPGEECSLLIEQTKGKGLVLVNLIKFITKW